MVAAFFFSLCVCISVFLSVYCVFTSVLLHCRICIFPCQQIILQIVVKFEIIHFAGLLISIISLALFKIQIFGASFVFHLLTT